MSGLPLDILRFFEQYPGDLLFFLVIIALGQVSLFFAFGQQSRFPTAQVTRRHAIAASALIGIWIVILFAAIVSSVSTIEPGSLLPPLERLAKTLSVTLFAWAFLAADEEVLRRPGNLSAFGTVLIVLIFFLYTAYQWYVAFEVGDQFNGSVFAPVWSALPVAIAIAGLLVATFDSVSIVDAPLKGLFLLLILLGNGWDLYQFSEGAVAGSYLGGSRLAYMGALFVVPLILYRQTIALLEDRLAHVAAASSPPVIQSAQVEQREQDAASAQLGPVVSSPANGIEIAALAEAKSETLLAALGKILDIDEGSTIAQQVVQVTIAEMEVDLCLFLQRQDSNYAELTAGYHAVTQQSFSGTAYSLDAQPSLRKAFDDGQPVALSVDMHGDELTELFRQLMIDAPGSVYIQPVTRRDDILALIVVSVPNINDDLSSGQIGLLAALANVAGQILAWKGNAEATAAVADPVDSFAGDMEVRVWNVDSADILAARRQLVASFEQTAQDIALVRLTIAELLIQLEEERKRLLGDLGEDAESIAVAQQVTTIFDERTRLREAGEKAATELLDAETVLRIVATGNDNERVEVIHDYVQKSYDLQIASRDRLQRQLDALKSNGASLRHEEATSFVNAIVDQSRQLETEVEHQEARLAEVLAELDSIGLNPELGNLTQVMIQHFAEQLTLKNVVTEIQRHRDELLDMRSQLTAAGVEEIEALSQQLRQTKTDHEALLDQREEMRRAYEELQSALVAKGNEYDNLVDESSGLRQELSASAAKHLELNAVIAEISEERENLLRIRDQLTNRLAESLEGGGESAEPALRTEVSELRAVVNDLTSHRERLETELSELRMQASRVDPIPLDMDATADQDRSIDTEISQAYVSRIMEDLKSPVTAIMDGTTILLAERIGILGAAQLRVLQNVSDNIERLIEILSELRYISSIEDDGYTLEYHKADLVALLDETLSEQTEILRSKALAIDMSLGDGLPHIPMDAICISRILNQLLSNACEVSSEGSQIQLAIETARQTLPATNAAADVLLLRISDCGGGIEPEDIDRLFARKYKSENPKIKGFSDRGVGMTVSRAQARAHGGDVWITSERGVGSTVHLALPISPSSTTEE